jgi:5-oxoprolinase (ATP-hydrolysing)
VVEEYGLKKVQEYMEHIRTNAEISVRSLLRRIAKELGTELAATDYLDDGTPVRTLQYQPLRSLKPDLTDIPKSLN